MEETAGVYGAPVGYQVWDGCFTQVIPVGVVRNRLFLLLWCKVGWILTMS